MKEPSHGVRHVAHNLPERVLPGEVFAVRLELENSGSLAWRAASPGGADSIPGGAAAPG